MYEVNVNKVQVPEPYIIIKGKTHVIVVDPAQPYSKRLHVTQYRLCTSCIQRQLPQTLVDIHDNETNHMILDQSRRPMAR